MYYSTHSRRDESSEKAAGKAYKAQNAIAFIDMFTVY